MPRKEIEPIKYKECSKCNRAYGFVRCRVTISDKAGVRNICLECAAEEPPQSNSK